MTRDLHREKTELELQLLELRSQMHAAAHINPEYLEGEFLRISADLSYWSSRCARMHGELLRAQARTRRLRGLYEIRERRILEKERGRGSKYVSESMVAAAVEQCEDWETAYEDEIEARVAYEEHKGHLEALRAKRDMLIQLGADRRKEWDLDPVVREDRRAGRHLSQSDKEEDDNGKDE